MIAETATVPAPRPATATVTAHRSVPLWSSREATLNWLALGLLLAAWNASYNEVPERRPVSRPESLRGYPYISVRALQRLRDNTNAR